MELHEWMECRECRLVSYLVQQELWLKHVQSPVLALRRVGEQEDADSSTAGESRS